MRDDLPYEGEPVGEGVHIQSARAGPADSKGGKWLENAVEVEWRGSTWRVAWDEPENDFGYTEL